VQKSDYLKEVVQHADVTAFDTRALIRAYGNMSFQARNLANATDIVDRMMADTGCGVILTLAGSLCSSGLKDAIALMIENNMVDALVSTGANIVDQDFFEALGFRHYKGNPQVDDNTLRELGIDRIYDTYIDEADLRICDETIAELCRREGISSGMYYKWSKEFLEAGKQRLAGNSKRQADSDEVKELRRQNEQYKQLVAELSLKNRVLKKSLLGWDDRLGD